MDIIYISAMFDSEAHSRIYNKEKKPMHAANKYHQLLCRGLAENGANVVALSSLPVNPLLTTKKFIRIKPAKLDGFMQKYITTFNLPILHHVSLMVNTFFSVLFAKRKSVVLFDVLVVSASMGAVAAAKLSGKKAVGIVTDLPQFMPIAQNSRMLKVNQYLFDKADGYIFLTKYMDRDTNPKGKPCVILEGHVDKNMINAEHKGLDSPIRKVLYAGTLNAMYGIRNLCESFARADIPNAQLHIYGDGDYAPKLRELIKTYPNIFYHGNCPNAQVVEQELESALLVNPRPTAGDYTQYSFPSKTLEYLVSGTPVLTAHLAGIPEEYDEHLYYFDDKDPDGLMNALKEILAKSSEELAAKGSAAKAFALSQKSNVTQSAKILDFLQDKIF